MSEGEGVSNSVAVALIVVLLLAAALFGFALIYHLAVDVEETRVYRLGTSTSSTIPPEEAVKKTTTTRKTTSTSLHKKLVFIETTTSTTSSSTSSSTTTTTLNPCLEFREVYDRQSCFAMLQKNLHLCDDEADFFHDIMDNESLCEHKVFDSLDSENDCNELIVRDSRDMEYCGWFFAVIKGDPDLCNEHGFCIEKTGGRCDTITCKRYVGFYMMDYSLERGLVSQVEELWETCGELENTTLINPCRTEAHKYNTITDEKTRNQLIQKYAIQDQNKDFCNHITKQGEQKKCRQKI